MKKNTLIKVLICVATLSLIAGCSTTSKNKTGASIADVDQGAQTQGLGSEDGLNDASSPFRLKAPYNQVYYFDFNQDAVHQADIASINAQATYLVAHPKARVRLEGNADDRGSREYNVALGWRRAKAVASILKQQGVNQNQIAMVSYGKEKPVAFGHDETSYSLNRRTNLIYEAK